MEMLLSVSSSVRGPTKCVCTAWMDKKLEETAPFLRGSSLEVNGRADQKEEVGSAHQLARGE